VENKTMKSLSVEVVIGHLGSGVSLLEQLHVLSQTEALVLDASNLKELSSIVAAKEALVARIRETEQLMAVTLAEVKPSWSKLPASLRHSVDVLKERALHLIDRISQVEAGNRIRLENLKTEIVLSSRTLLREQELLNAYSVPRPPQLHFSKLAD
jgi:hypothetical protein